MWPTPQEALRDVQRAVVRLRNVVVHQPYAKMWRRWGEGVAVLHEWGSDVMDTGVLQYARSLRDRLAEHVAERTRRQEARREQLWATWSRFPIISWWTAQRDPDAEPRAGIFTPFLNHLGRVLEAKRAEWRDAYERSGPGGAVGEAHTGGVFTMDLELGAVRDHFVRRWTQPVWTPRILANWRRVGNLAYLVYDAVYPGELTPEHRQRILFDGNCNVLVAAFNITTKAFGYCGTTFVMNARRSIRESALGQYVLRTAAKRADSFYNEENLRTRYDAVELRDPNAWSGRYRLKPRGPILAQPHPQDYIDRRVYKYATRSLPHGWTDTSQTGPAGFNLIGWEVNVVSSFLNGFFNVSTDSWIATAKAWLNNANTTEASFPYVGARYWIVFQVRCEFPENIDCVGGVGLEPAVIWVTVGIAAYLLVGGLWAPWILFITQIVSVPLLWLWLVGMIGLHYSPRCALLFPTLTGIGFAPPTCIVDSIINITDKYIVACPTGVLFPPCLVSGDPCPADPNTMIDFISCQAVGVSDGLQNWLYLGAVVFGNWFISLVNTVGSLVQLVLPGASNYLLLTFDSFTMAYDTQQCRQWWCFGLTVTAMLMPVVFVGLAFLLVAFVVPFSIAALANVYYFLMDTPLGDNMPGQEARWFNAYTGAQAVADANAADASDAPPPSGEYDPEEIHSQPISSATVDRWLGAQYAREAREAKLQAGLY